MSAGKLLPRAILIDMDDGILSAHGRPEIAWTNADAPWRPKLAEARHLTVKGGLPRSRLRATALCPTISP
jgi:putative hydrolase of the HAD superfamily